MIDAEPSQGQKSLPYMWVENDHVRFADRLLQDALGPVCQYDIVCTPCSWLGCALSMTACWPGCLIRTKVFGLGPCCSCSWWPCCQLVDILKDGCGHNGIDGRAFHLLQGHGISSISVQTLVDVQGLHVLPRHQMHAPLLQPVKRRLML